MSYQFFSIGDNDNSTGQYGFVDRGDSINASSIEDKLFDNGDILNKMGSSIPTPFARMYLFDSAFKQINSFQNIESLQSIAHSGVLNNKGETVPTSHHYLVSECLDMLEFIFKYGDDKRFTVLAYNISEGCDDLIRKGSEAQRNLGLSMKDSYEKTVLNANNPSGTIYLFKWDGVIIGGTSPITLVYTSPNLRRHIMENNWTNQFSGEAGNILFGIDATPLHERSEAFRRFLYNYRLKVFVQGDSKLSGSAIDKYISNSQTIYDKTNPEVQPDRDNITLDGVKTLNINGQSIKSAGASLYCSNNEFDASTCDYIIKPTVEIYKQETVHGAIKEVNIPAVLVKYGIDGYRYANRAWNPATDKIPACLEPNLSNRQLPGTTFTYPYLTEDDFLAEKLIEVSYNINKGKFHTGTNTTTQHLLPLKKEFFKFFSIDDIKDMVQVIVDHEEDTVTVELSIPTTGGEAIHFKRTYTDEKRVACYDASHTLNLAVFPSYKINIGADGQDHNIYNVMVGTTIADLKVNFIKASDLCNDTQHQAINGDAITDVERTNVANEGFTTRHITVKSSFDMMEITVTDTDGTPVSGLVIPNFTEVNEKDAFNKFTFCVDFGTTNTHVALVKSTRNNDNPFNLDQVQDFEIIDSDTQMMLLNEGAFGYFLKFRTFLMREFVPALINKDHDLHYPMRTTTWESSKNVNSLRLFENMNIGFNYDSELSNRDDVAGGVGHYKTNIKWLRRDPLSPDRMRQYFKQLLWMMKNKSVLNDGGVEFEVVATYPQSMPINEIETFKDAWRQASADLMVNTDIKFELESVAPYFASLGNIGFGQPFLNLDIGGGTTDILHVTPNPGQTDKAVVFSAIYAANDIWGDGSNDANTPKQNGFVQAYNSSLEFDSLSDDSKANIELAKEKASTSADVISYLFTHDNDMPTRISQSIKSSNEMMQVPIVHFTSLMYYVAFALDLCELKIPTTISFTGMGSKYIKLLSSNEHAIANVINAVFKYYGRMIDNDKLKNANFNVQFVPNPKHVTAQGGLMKYSRSTKKLLSENGLCYGYNEEEYGDNLRYSQMREFREKVLEEFNNFTEIFKDNGVLEAFQALGYPIKNDLVGLLQSMAPSSFDLNLAQNSTQDNDNQKINEPMFFWPLKETLYQLGKHYAQDVVNAHKK